MVIVVRSDLNLSAGKVAAQVAHAAVNASFSYFATSKRKFRRWCEEGAKKVVLKVSDLNTLIALQQKAAKLHLNHYLVVDSGLTEIPPNTATCLAIGPDAEEKINKVTAHLPLF